MGTSAFSLSAVVHKIDVAESTSIASAGYKLETLGTRLRAQLGNIRHNYPVSESTSYQPVLYQGIWMPCTKFLVRHLNVQ